MAEQVSFAASPGRVVDIAADIRAGISTPMDAVQACLDRIADRSSNPRRPGGYGSQNGKAGPEDCDQSGQDDSRPAAAKHRSGERGLQGRGNA